MTKSEIRQTIKAALAKTNKLSDECQAAYGRGDVETGKQLESEFNAASKVYYDLCDANPSLAPRQNES